MCEARNSFRLICRTSFADYVETWLTDAAIEYGYSVRNRLK
jgi:sarcosine oxidase gamma subunit